MTGGLMLADSSAWLDYLKVAQGKGRVLGLDAEFVSIAEAKQRHPLINEKRFLGALYDPLEGHVDPSGVTHAYAKSARIGGAEIERFTRVVDLQPRPDGGRSEEHTSELQSLMRLSYAVFCLKKKK